MAYADAKVNARVTWGQSVTLGFGKKVLIFKKEAFQRLQGAFWGLSISSDSEI